MDRGALKSQWERFYSPYTPSEQVTLIEARANRIVSQMMRLARFPERISHGIVKRRLEIALGMSLGVHRQLLWGLTSDSRGGMMRREEGGKRR